MLATSLTAYAQGTTSGTDSGGGQSGSGTQHQRKTPEQMAQRLINKFDANKDGELSQAELTTAIETLRQNRAKKQQSASSGQSTGSSSTLQSGQTSQHRTPPAADKVAAKMIDKYSSDKKGLTESELAQAIAAHRANRAQHHSSGQSGSTNVTSTGSN